MDDARISIGAKSPLTNGIKEANAGGSFGLALGQLHVAGFTLYGISADTESYNLALEFLDPAEYDAAAPASYDDRLERAVATRDFAEVCDELFTEAARRRSGGGALPREQQREG